MSRTGGEARSLTYKENISTALNARKAESLTIHASRSIDAVIPLTDANLYYYLLYI